MRLPILLSTLLLATACTMNDPGSSTSGTDADRLTSEAWVFETVAGEALPDRVRVTMEFDTEGTRVFGLAACNRYTAGYTLDEKGFAVELLASTKMACPDALMRAEERFLGALRSVESYDFDAGGKLRLHGTDGALSLAVAEPRGLTE